MEANCRCAIWGTPAVGDGNAVDDGTLVDSPRAGGRYFVSGTAEAMLEPLDDRLKARLTTWLVEQRRLGNDRPEITSATINEAQARPDLRVAERADRVLQCLETKVPRVRAGVAYRVFHGVHQYVNLEPADEFYLELLACSECVQSDELGFLIDYLRQREYLRAPADYRRGGSCVLTVAGYERLAALAASHTPSVQGFVAMWFDPSMHEVWEHGIRPGIVAAGYVPLRIDQKEHANKIDDEIIAEIRKSRFVVADFTQGADGARGGVYYEAGFAHGLDIAVIFTCRSKRLRQTPFRHSPVQPHCLGGPAGPVRAAHPAHWRGRRAGSVGTCQGVICRFPVVHRREKSVKAPAECGPTGIALGSRRASSWCAGPTDSPPIGERRGRSTASSNCARAPRSNPSFVRCRQARLPVPLPHLGAGTMRWRSSTTMGTARSPAPWVRMWHVCGDPYAPIRAPRSSTVAFPISCTPRWASLARRRRSGADGLAGIGGKRMRVPLHGKFDRSRWCRCNRRVAQFHDSQSIILPARRDYAVSSPS